MSLFKFDIHESHYDGELIPADFDQRQWEIGVIGDRDVDARSKTACDFAEKHTDYRVDLDYSPERRTLVIDGKDGKYGVLLEKLKGVKSILVEATSLSCPELLNIIRAATEVRAEKLSFLYLEPQDYRRAIKGRLSEFRDFDLSDNSRFQAVHNFVGNFTELSPGQIVFFLGYEKARLGQAIEQEEALQRWRRHAVFGVPAFEATWEIDAISNNINHLASAEYSVQYCAAASAKAAYMLLVKLLEEDKARDTIAVAPLGTKPHTIGSALFLVQYTGFDRAVLLFDHPNRRAGRSKDIRRWRMFDVDILYSN